MHSSTLFQLFLCTLGALSNVLAQDVDPVKACPAQGPFKLRIRSYTNPKFNGQYIVSTHIGAAIELAVLGGKIPGTPQFYNNYTSYGFTTDPNGTMGPVSCDYGNLQSSKLSAQGIPLFFAISVDITKNVGQLWISVVDSLPGYGQFAFTKNGFLTLLGKQDWYVCRQKYESYGPFYAINWKIGTNGTPDDPSCEAVKIVKA